MWVPDELDPMTFLWSESAGRVIVVVPRSEEMRFTEMCAARGLPATRIGVVDSGLGAEEGYSAEGDAGQVLQLTGHFTVSLADLRGAREATLPELFG